MLRFLVLPLSEYANESLMIGVDRFPTVFWVAATALRRARVPRLHVQNLRVPTTGLLDLAAPHVERLESASPPSRSLFSTGSVPAPGRRVGFR